jgi:DNA-binding MarR family transcriptional regulator
MNTSHTTAQALLSTLPLVHRLMIVELKQENGEDTTMPQFRVLSYLSESPLTVSDIARLRRVSFQSAGELVQTLVERGWIERIPDPNDRRQSLLHLTSEGKHAYERAQSHMVERLSGLLDSLSQGEQNMIQGAMRLLQTLLASEEHDDRHHAE